MAFSKMVGFEVTPRRSSSSIFVFRSPDVSIARRMLSYQIDWPSFMISVRLLLIISFLETILLRILVALRLFDLALRRFDDVLDSEAELLRQLFERGRSAECLHADDLVVVRRVALPAEARGLFDGDARADGGRNDA